MHRTEQPCALSTGTICVLRWRSRRAVRWPPAGALLGVNHTTVLRRIAALEKRLGARLFERLPSGYALTPLGEELVEAARGIDETVGRLELKLAGADLAFPDRSG